MDALIGGSAVGVIGLLAGLVYGLWYKNKYANKRREYESLKKEHQKLEDDYDQLNETHNRVSNNYRAEIQSLRNREEERREEIRILMHTCDDPVVVNDTLNRLFPPVPGEGDP